MTNLVSITATRLGLSEFDLFVTAIKDTYRTVNIKQVESEYKLYIKCQALPRFLIKWCVKQNKILDKGELR